MNTCEEKTRKSGSKSSKKSASKSARSGKSSRSRSALLLASTCEGPGVPAVSSDCGINSPVVRIWSSRPAGMGAPWGITPSVWFADCDCGCGCEESFYSCC